MSKLPTFKRMYQGDYPQQYQDLISQLSLTYNPNIESLYDVLSNGLTFQDNFIASVNTITVTTNSNAVSGVLVSGTDISGNAVTTLVNGSYGLISTPSFKLNNFDSNTTATIDGCIVLSITNLTKSNSYPISGVTLSFTQKNNVILVNNITGLDKNSAYSLTILTIGH